MGLMVLKWIIEQMGAFPISIDFHTVLRDVGTFVAGTNSIIFKWADFTSNIVPGSEIRASNIITLLSDLDVERDVLQAKYFYRDILEKGQVECVWSGRKLQANMHIDHLLPFSALHNNDLWNLLPSSDAINIKKKDAIPTKALLSERKIRDRVIGYWEKLHATFEGQFIRELNISLLGRRLTEPGNWQIHGYEGLIDMSEHLIHNRGLTPWNYKIH
jgi:CRISPR/Cas system Type II protein with McrA/HNH and RuvC-like nuclease domain